MNGKYFKVDLPIYDNHQLYFLLSLLIIVYQGFGMKKCDICVDDHDEALFGPSFGDLPFVPSSLIFLCKNMLSLSNL